MKSIVPKHRLIFWTRQLHPIVSAHLRPGHWQGPVDREVSGDLAIGDVFCRLKGVLVGSCWFKDVYVRCYPQYGLHMMYDIMNVCVCAYVFLHHCSPESHGIDLADIGGKHHRLIMYAFFRCKSHRNSENKGLYCISSLRK